MECVKEKTIEDKIKGDNLRIEDLIIAGKEYSLNIMNKEGQLSFWFNYPLKPDNFSAAEYMIIIDEKGLRFNRFVSRPDHDHDDSEDLQVIVDPKKTGTGKQGDLVWRKRYPYKGEGYEFFYIPFGAVED